MGKNVTIIRGASKSIPDDFLARALAANKACAAFAVASTDGSKIVVRKHLGTFSLDEAKQWISHESLKTRQIVVHFGDDPNMLTEADVQPYVVLADAEGKAKIVAFLNGDFSQFEETGSISSPEYFCVHKQIMPRVKKAFKLADEDLHKTMEELKDEINAYDWANFMIGSNGSITLLAANGEVNTYLVNGETISGDLPGCWASNVYAEKPAVEQDDLTKELEGDAPAPAPKVIPPTEQPKVAPGTPKVIKPRPGHGLEGHKAPGSSPSTVVPARQPDVRPAPGPAPVSDPKPVTDPAADPILTLTIPLGMDNKRRFKFLNGIMPGGFDISKFAAGNKTISCKRSEATPKFLQKYLEQNKLSGLDAVGPQQTSTLIPKDAGSVPKVIPAKGKEQGYPERAEEQPATAPQKDTAPHIVGKPAEATPAVNEPTPVFSPRQIEETINFKDVVDKKGNKIVSPEDMEKKVGTFASMFGDKFKLESLANWDEKDMEAYAQHDAKAVAKLLYWTVMELRKVEAMLNELTDPHLNKKAEETAPASHETAARILRPKIIKATKVA